MFKHYIPLILALVCAITALAFYITKKNSRSVIEMDVHSDIYVANPYAFATSPTAKTAAAFMVITNKMGEDDALIGVESTISEVTEIHENMIDKETGTMMMRRINTLPIPANTSLSLDPAGYHVMFINMKQLLNTGDMFPVSLIFEKSGIHTITVEVVPAGVTPENQGHDTNHE